MKILLLALIAVAVFGQDTRPPVIPDRLLLARSNTVNTYMGLQLRLTQMAAALEKAKVDILQNEAKLRQESDAVRKEYEAVIATISKEVCEPAAMIVEDKGDTIACIKKAPVTAK